jgi:Concanavalin A-like lectin/glucanases superfamily
MKATIPSTTTSTGWLLQFALFLFCTSICFGQTSPIGDTNGVSPGTYVCVQRGPDSKVWQETFLSTNASGDVTTNIQSYTELATGICYLTNNEYVDSVEEVDPVPGGAQAVQGRHQVYWALNANTPGGAVTVATPDGKQLSSTVFGLAYFDLATGSNAVIGQLKDCNGSIVNTNQVVYADAFSNITADIDYTYTKAGLSQDILLRQSLLPPDAYGLGDTSTILQVYSEFFNSPTPVMTAVTNDNVVDDQLLDFGDMKMAVGQAFFVNAQGGPILAGIVTKQWVQVNNRTFLIEAIPYSAISNQLQQLPNASNIKPDRGSIRRLAFLESSPSRSNGFRKGEKSMELAKADTTRPRLTVDYVLLSSSTNLTLQSDTTFFVSGIENITGTTTIEGGTVVKFSTNQLANPQIVTTNVVCQTGPFTPGVFTSMNDNTVGAFITNSTGAPSRLEVNYINFGANGVVAPVFSNLRFSYANAGVYLNVSSSSAIESIEFLDCQFVQCGAALDASYASTTEPNFPFYFYNVLFSQCANAVNGSASAGSVAVIAVNMTADQMGTFIGLSGSVSCAVTNSLFTSVTNFSSHSLSSVSLFSCGTNATRSGIYTNVGAGGYYLVSGSTNQGVGTTNINTNLLADLQTRTTWPPIVYAGWWTNNYMFAPQAERNTNAPDRGYHYSPIDYAFCVAVSNATITVLPGTVLAGFSTNGNDYGIWLYTNGIVDCEGTAINSNCFVRYNTVQEQSNTNWATTSWNALLITPSQADSSWANFAFTDWSVLTSDGEINALTHSFPITLEDCQFYEGTVTAENVAISATNCLFRRVNTTMTDAFGPNVSVPFCNNLFWRGELAVSHFESGTFTFRDNLFDEATVTMPSLLGTNSKPIDVCSNNAYVTTNFGFLSPTNGDIFLTNSPAYQSNFLGAYYYPTNQTNLIHKGSQPAEDAGLYFYTVTTNEVIEGDNTVSIGFHYVAVTNDAPLDTDTMPAVPDYLDDLPGNGVLNPFLIFDQWNYPNEPQVRLGYWRFNTAALTNEAGVPPITATGTNLAADWSSNALVMTNTNSLVQYPVTTNGASYFNCTNGTIRFWFKPTWTSGSNAPYVVFFDCGSPDEPEEFSLSAQDVVSANVIVTNTGNITNYSTNMLLAFNTVSNKNLCYQFSYGPPSQQALNFQAGNWYQLCLTYSPSNAAFYTNGVLVVTHGYPPSTNGYPDFELGSGVIFYPSAAIQDAGFSIGSSMEGSGQVMGSLDELETFNYPLTAQQVAAGYPYFGGNSNNMVDTYYIGVSDMLQTNVDGLPQAASTNSIPVRLGYWRFNSPLLYAEQGQMPLSTADVGTAQSWSGTSLVISNNSDSHVTYADVGSNGWANVNCQQGSMRFWFKPNSSSTTTAPFVYMGSSNGQNGWGLWLNSPGTSITFVSSRNGNTQTALTSACNLTNTNQWTQIVLTYGTNGSSLYINGLLATNGAGNFYVPALTYRQLGMVIGNNTAYAQPINGQFEEFETFNYQLSSSAILSNFQTVSNVDSDLDGIPDLLEDIKLPTNRPFLGAPVVITGTIEAEQFDMGGPGIGYSNTFTPSTNCYRPTGMMISSCTDLGGGYCLDHMQSNEWAVYTINVLVAQNYVIDTRASGIVATGGVFRVEFTNAGALYSTNTGSLIVPTLTWTDVTNVVYLKAGTYTMKLDCLTDAPGDMNVGRFNYISIYPWWPPPTNGPQTGSFTNCGLVLGSNYLQASNNAYAIQSAVNSLGAAGGTVTIPAGTWYVSQPFPNDANDAYSNAVACITNSNVTIAGSGTNATNTILIANNRATTIFVLGQSPNGTAYACSNFTITNLTLEANPHEVATNCNCGLGYTNIYELGQLDQSGAQGDLAVFYGWKNLGYSYNILISNCVFLNGIKSLVPDQYISNFMVVACAFIPWQSNLYFTSTTNNSPSNTLYTTIWQVGNVGIMGDGPLNAMIVSNTYIGNSALTNVQSSYSSNSIAPDGFVWFQSSGNVFVAGNVISNNALEGVQLNAGPNAVVGNRYDTLVSDASCCALCATGGQTGATGAGLSNYWTCFVGNSIYGGREGERGAPNVSPFFLNFSDNSLYLYPPFNTNGDSPGYVATVQACQTANICGNMLSNGGYGLVFSSTNASALILNNNFGAASYCGIGTYFIFDSLSSAQIFGNTIGEGVNFHIQLPYTNSFSWFLGSNTYWNVNSNSVSPFFDPASAAVHIFN